MGRKLLNSLCLSAVRSLVKFLHTATGLELMPGVVAVIQTFGDRINFHPHIHCLLTEGSTAPDGVFHRVSRFHDDVIREIFTREVFSLLLRKKLIGLSLVQKILNWRHTGFNVHSKVKAQTKSEAERVGKYMIRYYGLYSNAHRGKVRKAGTRPSHPPIIEDDPTYVPSKGWAEMICKVYEIDPLLCLSCGGQMSVISFIEEPKTIDRIIRHLELTFEAERPPPPHHVQHGLLLAAEEMGGVFLRASVAVFC
jgi:hypothetical protein